MNLLKIVPSVLFILVLNHLRFINCCDLEHFFSEKQVSVEESTKTSQVIFRGLSTVKTLTSVTDLQGVFTAYFELINTYKGAEALDVVWDVLSNYRWVFHLLYFLFL